MFYHPMIGLLSIGILVGYWSYLWFESGTSNQTNLDRSSINALIFLLFIPLAIFVEWHLGLTKTQSQIRRILLSFIQSDQSAASFAGQAVQTGYTLLELIWQFLILQWGPTVIYLGLAGLVFIAVGYRIWRHRTVTVDNRITVLFLLGIGTAIVSLVLLRMRNPVRATRFAVLMAIYLIALELWHRQQENWSGDSWNSHAVAHSFLAIIIVIALLAGGITYQGDAHLTETTVEGTTWQLEHGNHEVLTLSHRMARNLDIFKNGYRQGKSNERVFTRYNSTYKLPKHIGYDENRTIATTLVGQRYLVTKYSDTVWYRNQPKSRYSGLLFYNQSDVAALANDPAADRLYNNGNFSVWLANE